jgi:hypothetical protein
MSGLPYSDVRCHPSSCFFEIAKRLREVVVWMGLRSNVYKLLAEPSSRRA